MTGNERTVAKRKRKSALKGLKIIAATVLKPPNQCLPIAAVLTLYK